MIIDASTIIPIPNISPAIVILLIVRSKNAIHINVINIEIGIDREMIIVALIFLKNKKITNAARIIPSNAEV